VAADGSYHFTFPRSADDKAPLMSLHEITDGAEPVLHYGDPAVAGIPGQGWYSVREEEALPNAVLELRRAGATSTAFAAVFLMGKRANQNADLEFHRTGTSATLAAHLPDTTISVDIHDLADAASETVTVH
jgi:hypothetical protein